ncbi:MAG: SRPBCC family protein [Myxococcota bacterium]
MTTIAVRRIIAADPDLVFREVTDIERFPKTVPEVMSIEFLGELRQGPGTRFREHRLVNGRPMAFELEVAEYDAPARRARFVTDAGGTLWDTTMRVDAIPEGAGLEFIMVATGHAWFNRAVNWLMQGVYRRGMSRQLEALAIRCEAESRNPRRSGTTEPHPAADETT